MALQLSNPAFKDSVFDRARDEDRTAPLTMTVQGTVIKTMVLLAILFAAAGFTWWQTLTVAEAAVEGGAAVTRLHALDNVWLFVIVGCIGGFITALVTMFVPRWSPVTAPLYAGFEGLALGGISAVFENFYPGIVIQAVGLTFGTLAVMLVLYMARILQATARFQAIVVTATCAIAVLYLVEMVMRLFGAHVPYIHESGLIGIGFSLFVVGIAALNLILDFGLIERNASAGAPRYMEWYCGFALLLTLVWLYLEILKLLSKLQSRD